jgi:hypothetical protein
MAILSEAARICAESLNVRHCKVCRYREAEDDLLVEAGFGRWAEHWKSMAPGTHVDTAFPGDFRGQSGSRVTARP